MDGSFMEDLWKGLIIWAVIFCVASFLLGAGVVLLIMRLA